MIQDPRIANSRAWDSCSPGGQAVERRPVVFNPVSALDLVHDHPALRPFVIDGLLREGEVMNIVAGPKIGKSWLSLGLVLAVAAGTDWLVMRTSRGRVLLIDAELHKETLAGRLRKARIAAKAGQDDMQNFEVWPIRGQGWDIDDIATALAAVEKGTYRVIVIDALYRVLPPGCEENRNDSMTLVYNRLDSIAATTGAAVVVVHHATKGNQSEKAVTDVGSGAGAQSRAADTHLVLRQHEEGGAVVVDAAVRSFAPMKAIVIRNTNPGWELAPDLDPTKGEEASPPPPRTWTPEQFAREIVGADPVIKEEILHRARSAKLSMTEAKNLLKRAEVDGHLTRTQAGPSDPHRLVYTPRQGGPSPSAPPAPGASRSGGYGGERATPLPPLTPQSRAQETNPTGGAS